MLNCSLNDEKENQRTEKVRQCKQKTKNVSLLVPLAKPLCLTLLSRQRALF